MPSENREDRYMQLFKIAVGSFENGRYEEVLTIADELIRIKTGFFVGYNLKGDTLMALNRPEDCA